MRKLLAAVLATALAAVLAATALGAARTVKVGDNWFVRDGRGTPSITVAKGTRVRFTWVGRNPHNVRAYEGPARFRSDTKTSGTFKKRLRKKGTYRILCDVHQATMRMTITVR